MLNITAEKDTAISVTAMRQPKRMSNMWSCDLLYNTHLSFSFLIFSRWSSVMCSDGGLKWDMTTRNCSKPISSTVPSPFWRKFLKENSRSFSCDRNMIPPPELHLCSQATKVSNNRCCTVCQRRPLWSVNEWDCMRGLEYHWSDLSWGCERDFKGWHKLSHNT